MMWRLNLKKCSILSSRIDLTKSYRGRVLFLTIGSLVIFALPIHAEVPQYSVYVVDSPITNQTILPGRPLPAVCKSVKTLEIKACPGEYEPASFVVVTKERLESVRIEVGTLSGPAGILAKDVVDVRIAKPWAQDYPVDELPWPVLLLKDDSLIETAPNPIPQCPTQMKNVIPHGLRDSKELLPVRIDNLKQF